MPEYVPETGLITVEANGLTFACVEEGEGPLVVLLHGFPDTARTWDVVQPAIARLGFRAVAPFLRGYAPTSVPETEDFGAETLGRDVLALIEALGHDSAIVVGHDWGALSAYAAAALGPERVSKLVTLAIPHPGALRPTPAKVWGVRHFLTLQLPGAVGRLARDDAAGVRTFYERWSPTHDWPDSELEPVRNAFRSPGSLNAALGYYRALRPIQPKFLRQPISVPTLCIGGLDDGVAVEADYTGAASMFSSGYEVAMTRGGHFLHREFPDEVLAALLPFLES